MRDSLVRSTNAVAAMVLWAVVITSGLASEPESINGLFKNYCTSCHQGDDAEGGIALDELALLNSENAEFWQRILMQLATGEMPPDGEKRPSLDKREEVIGWITAGLTSAGVEPRLPGGALPTDGNLIDHDRLFSGKFKGPAYSPPRFWRRSQSQYDALSHTAA